MGKFESSGWSWSRDSHSSCGYISLGGCERASIRGWLLKAPFLLGDRREMDTNSWTYAIQSRAPASDLPSRFQSQAPSFSPLFPFSLCSLPLTITALVFKEHNILPRIKPFWLFWIPEHLINVAISSPPWHKFPAPLGNWLIVRLWHWRMPTGGKSGASS